MSLISYLKNNTIRSSSTDSTMVLPVGSSDLASIFIEFFTHKFDNNFSKDFINLQVGLLNNNSDGVFSGKSADDAGFDAEYIDLMLDETISSSFVEENEKLDATVDVIQFYALFSSLYSVNVADVAEADNVQEQQSLDSYRKILDNIFVDSENLISNTYELSYADILLTLSNTFSALSIQKNLYESGFILTVGDGIAVVYGLPSVQSNELVLLKDSVYGLAMNLQRKTIGVVLFGNDALLGVGDVVIGTSQIVSIPTGNDGYLGRIVDSLGNFIDGLPNVEFPNRSLVDVKAPGIVARESVRQSLFTGIKAIDSMIPIGKGQRELVIGDRQTGKSAIVIDTIINQRDEQMAGASSRVYCIYVVIGQKNQL